MVKSKKYFSVLVAIMKVVNGLANVLIVENGIQFQKELLQNLQKTIFQIVLKHLN